MIEFTEEARKMIMEDLVALIPTLSDEALRCIAVILLDEKRIMEKGGSQSENGFGWMGSNC